MFLSISRFAPSRALQCSDRPARRWPFGVPPAFQANPPAG
jgi:hypothetical protein